MKAKCIAIDFGLARIGLAVSDATGSIALPWKTLKTPPSLPALAQLLSGEFASREPSVIILGLPLLLSGKESPLSIKVRELAVLLQECMPHCRILFWDERLSSAQAEKALGEGTLSRKKRSQYIDMTAATLILQSYLEKERML